LQIRCNLRYTYILVVDL